MRKLMGLLALAAGCSTVTGGDDGVKVRLHNLSSVTFDSVTVQFPEDTHRYGRLDAGERSAYARVRQAYRYARIEAWVEQKSYVLQPIDFVGEHLLPDGEYTYGLMFGGEPPQLDIVMADTYADEDGVLFLTAREPATAVMEALFQGRVVVDRVGCIRFDSETGANVVWPYGFRLVERDGEKRVLTNTGREIGRLGGSFRFGGGFVGQLPDGVLDEGTTISARRRCPGEYWIVGEV